MYIPLIIAGNNVGTRHNKNPVYIRHILLKKRKQWSKYKNNSNTHDTQDEFKSLREELKKEIRKWRAKNEHNILRYGCAKKMYQNANSKLHTKHLHINLHDENGSVMSDKNAAEAFNAYFGSI